MTSCPCGKPVLSRGLCSACYNRAWRNGSVGVAKAAEKELTCIKCEKRPRRSRNLCAVCYNAARVKGIHLNYPSNVKINPTYAEPPPTLDNGSGEWSDEKPGSAEYSGNGLIRCQECGMRTNLHPRGVFCYIRKTRNQAVKKVGRRRRRTTKSPG